MRASYAFASAREKVTAVDNVNESGVITFAPEQPNPQDQRHAINLDGTWRPKPGWAVNLSWARHSGWPVTTESMFTEPGPGGSTLHVIRPDQLYGGRLPSYQRADVRLTRRRPISTGEFRFFVDQVNVTNHSNVFGYDVFREVDGSGQSVLRRDPETWFTILPSLGASWTGRF